MWKTILKISHLSNICYKSRDLCYLQQILKIKCSECIVNRPQYSKDPRTIKVCIHFPNILLLFFNALIHYSETFFAWFIYINFISKTLHEKCIDYRCKCCNYNQIICLWLSFQFYALHETSPVPKILECILHQRDSNEFALIEQSGDVAAELMCEKRKLNCSPYRIIVKKRKASWSYASITQYEFLLALNYFVIKTLAAFLSHSFAVAF
jgi:hypothetical protein